MDSVTSSSEINIATSDAIAANTDAVLTRKSVLPYPSFINVFKIPSSESTTFRLTSDTSSDSLAKSYGNERKIVYDVVDKMFNEKLGNFDASSSYCSSVQKNSSEYSYDRRLTYWRNMVEERKRIANYIKNKTGKKQCDMLFNRSTTIDERNKQTVKRIMDYAERMNPLKLANKKQLILPEYIDETTCVQVNELHETLPKAERDKQITVEICGLPEIAKEEQLGKRKDRGVEKNHNWLKSKVLEYRVCEKKEDIERVIEYYPDIDNLQIIGESLFKSVIEHNTDIEVLDDEYIKSISSDSICRNVSLDTSIITKDRIPEYAIKINDQVFKLPSKRSSKNVEIEARFDSDPFEYVTQRVVRLENIGRKIINCEWVNRPYFEKNNALLKSTDKEFFFDKEPFRLISGEIREILIEYQPRQVDVVKEKWILRIDPQFFCRRIDSVVIKLSGRCRRPIMYVEKLKDIQSEVILKSNKKMMDTLTTGLASITPLVQPPDQVCPYSRLLNEMELFEQYNPGYKCQRFNDLELLKDLHKRVKKPREPAWDLFVDSLKALILRQETAERRALFFNELMGILQEMRGKPVDLEVQIAESPERDRSRLLYVRGLMVTTIDDWEEMTVVLEDAFLKTEMDKYYRKLLAIEEAAENVEGDGNNENDEEEADELMLIDEDSIEKMLTKKIRYFKPLRDSLYVQTYNTLCNFVEDMVSVIESTEVI